MRNRWQYIFAGVGAGLFVYWLLLIIKHPVTYDVTEGVIFHRALLIAGGGDIYPQIGSPPYFVTPYTPLFIMVTGALIKIFGPLIWLGRIESIISLIGTLLVAAYMVKSKCGGYLRSLACISLLLCSYHVIANATSISPQWTGIFFSVAGLALFTKNKPYLAFLVMSLGVLTKQSQIIAPVSALLWTAGASRKTAFKYWAFFIACTFLEFLALYLFFGDAFPAHVLKYTVGNFDLMNLARLAGYCILPYFIFIIIAGAAICHRYKSKNIDLLSIYFLLNAAWLFAAARLGADSRYFLEFYVALLMLIAPYIYEGSYRLKLASIVQMIMLVIFTCYMFHWNGQRVAERHSALREILPVLSAIKGDIIVEDPFVALASGHRLYLEAFPMSELAKKGLWDKKPFVEDLKSGVFPAIVLQFDIDNDDPGYVADERFGREMRVAIRSSYKLDRIAGPFYLYKPVLNKE